MRKLIAEFLLFSLGVASMPTAAAPPTNENLELKKDAYGLDVHSDQYGRPWKSEPGQKLEKDAYGPGVHMDQYGRPIRQHPKQPGQGAGELK
jgi:hypothetical protein